MRIRIYTRMQTYNGLETFQLVEVSLFHLSGHGNGGRRRLQRIEEEAGEIAAAYVDF